MGWQPISTAPKDGTRILISSGKGYWKSIYIGEWVDYYGHGRGKWTTGYTCADEGDFDIDDATHWMPLPAPP